jgi:hypothetical protein
MAEGPAYSDGKDSPQAVRAGEARLVGSDATARKVAVPANDGANRTLA